MSCLKSRIKLRSLCNRARWVGIFALIPALVVQPLRAADIRINIVEGRSVPADVAVATGDTVTWLAGGENNVTVVEVLPVGWRSGYLAAENSTFSQAFVESGTFAYRHQWYVGSSPPYAKIGSGLGSHGLIKVIEPTNGPAKVWLFAPVDRAVFEWYNSEPEWIQLHAAVADELGAIDRMEFYNGTNLLAAVRGPPYVFQYTNAPLGGAALRARAIPSDGPVVDSPHVIVTFEETFAPRLGNTRFLAPGLFAFEYTIPFRVPGLGYVVHGAATTGYGPELKGCRGSGTFIWVVGTNINHFFYIQARH